MAYPENFMNLKVGDTLWLVFSVCNQVLTQVFGKISAQQWPRKAKASPRHAVNALYRATQQMHGVVEAQMIRPPESGTPANAGRNSRRATGRGLRDWQPVAEMLK